MSNRSIKKKLFHFSTFLTSIISVPLLLFISYQLLITEDKLVEIQNQSNVKINKLEKQNRFAYKLLEDIFNERVSEDNFGYVDVTLTGYSATESECDNEPEIMGNGELSMVNAIARSKDMPKAYGIGHGKRIFVPSYNIGVVTVKDSMNDRFSKRLDIMMGNKLAAKKFGLKKNVRVYYFKEN